MKCSACGEDFDFEYKLDEHHLSTGHIGKTEQFTPAQERRKNAPDRRTHCGRFALESGPGRLQMLLNPDLVFLNRCPKHLKEAYARLRGELDTFMVDIAQEVAKRDGVESSLKSRHIAETRGQHNGKETSARYKLD